MSTWQIFSDAGKDCRWEVSGRITRSKPQDGPNGALSPPLPSMEDLLLQGCSKLVENGGGGDGKSPLFRTGLGKSVVLKESSLAKALSVLGENLEDGGPAVPDELLPRKDGCGYSSSLFQTGSGKTVNVSSAGLLKARTLLGSDEDIAPDGFQSFQHPRKFSANNEPFGWQSMLHLREGESINSAAVIDATSLLSHSPNFNTGLPGRKFGIEDDSTLAQSKMFNSVPKPPPIKFHTAGGKSLSVSSDALKRARSLLGDPEIGNFFDEADADDPSSSFHKERRLDDTSSNKENVFGASFSHQGTRKSKQTPSFISPLKSSLKQARSLLNWENILSGSNLIKKFDEVGDASACSSTEAMASIQKYKSNKPLEPNLLTNNFWPNGAVSMNNSLRRSSGEPLTDISNSTDAAYANNNQTIREKRRIGRTSSISAFKKPRSSRFSTPLNRNVNFISNGLSTLSSEPACCKRTLSTRYPFQLPRVYVKEYFGLPPSACSKTEPLSDPVKRIKPGNADNFMFKDESGLDCIGAEAFCDMLAQSGASMQYISKEWITNHYKWIVWKLASYERCYPTKGAGKFLTISNVLEELKYRYEREVNHGQRSAIKRVLEGDASPSTMMVLCVSDIRLNNELNMETCPVTTNGVTNGDTTKVELTDGWYSVDAMLDVLLSKQLAAGKIFIGQKLRIRGAGLCGWVGPVSPLEASRTGCLLLNINGTYRSHWADRLGFCKGVRAPLAFRCIKSHGGPVPQTLVGVTRIYPVLYKERLQDGGSVIRSERLESKMTQLHNQRRSIVVEGIVSEYQRINSSHIHHESDSEEGAKILKILETAAEPEVIMAEMSPEQLTSFATYKSKLEATRQTEMEKSVEKALSDAGLREREVTPFMRVRVVGLTCRKYQGKENPKEGIITIWNPTEKQKSELVEGQAYAVTGLLPFNSDSETLYLHARGSTTRWQPLSARAKNDFKPFFSPRKPILLSNLGDIPLSSEFDIAAFVVYVGEVYTTAYQKKQWVFVTDNSISNLVSENLSNSLLAISFCSPCIDDDSFAPINSNLVGSTVGFCNVVKKAKDQVNHLWVAEATENSEYFLSLNRPICSHLKNAAASVQTWAELSIQVVNKLREKVLFILSNCKA